MNRYHLAFVLALPVLTATTAGSLAGMGRQDSFVQVTKTLPGRDTDTLVFKKNGKTVRCGMSGNATKEEDKALDRLKNRHSEPTEFDSGATLEMMMGAQTGTNAFDQTKGAVLTGYFVKLTPEKEESCNCGSPKSVDWDFHCFLAFTPSPNQNERIVFEVTPRMRFWSKAQLQKLVGKRIRITGWIADDFKHSGESEADSPGKPGNWRASCWEIHPVTNIEV
ncbi:MAG: hypothetical protein HYR64_03005, partial [Fimbriimonas ginsengisoli]|nr:hypothetical protein [Fimbriimonas ginsengisoli]